MLVSKDVKTFFHIIELVMTYDFIRLILEKKKPI